MALTDEQIEHESIPLTRSETRGRRGRTHRPQLRFSRSARVFVRRHSAWQLPALRQESRSAATRLHMLGAGSAGAPLIGLCLLRTSCGHHHLTSTLSLLRLPFQLHLEFALDQHSARPCASQEAQSEHQTRNEPPVCRKARHPEEPPGAEPRPPAVLNHAVEPIRSHDEGRSGSLPRRARGRRHVRVFREAEARAAARLEARRVALPITRTMSDRPIGPLSRPSACHRVGFAVRR